MNLQEKILGYKDDVVKSMQEAIKIKSVEEAPLDGMPFGEGPAKALKYFLDLGREMGFEVENFDNYAGHIDFGTGEEILGILGHVDVVPEGEGWDHAPYAAEIADGKLYGRGILDNKGPMITCLYAMKAMKDAGIVPSKKIRMILGANEETGWKCMDHYFGELKMPQPTLAFTPDSSFPVTHAEKGISPLFISKKFEGIDGISFKGGTALNSVCEFVEGRLPVKYAKEVEEKLPAFNAGKEYTIASKIEGETLVLESQGKSAHGSRPSLGYNAANALMLFLKDIAIEEEALKDIINLFDTKFKTDYHGESLGIGFSDEPSGKLTINVGKISLENGEFSLGVDCRHPVTVETKKVVDTATESVASLGYALESKGGMGPLYVPKDDFLVETLMDIYKDITGDVKAEPVAIGGGTYARAVTNGVAFGALLHDQEDNMHQKNEYLEISKLDIWLKIYVDAIYKLSK